MVLCGCHSGSGVGGVNRPRSKTFEEYEKETDDIWNDKEEDLEALTHSAELDMVSEGLREEGEGQVHREGGRGNRRVNSKGKGKGQWPVHIFPVITDYCMHDQQCRKS